MIRKVTLYALPRMRSQAARDSFICTNEFTKKTYLIANNQSLISPPQDYQAVS